MVSVDPFSDAYGLWPVVPRSTPRSTRSHQREDQREDQHEDQRPVTVSVTADSQPAPATTPSSTWSSSGTAAISLKAGQIVEIPAADATAAYPIDPLFVDVTLGEGFAQVLGKFAGHTEIIIVNDSGVRNLPIDVTPAAPIYPPGFVLPQSAAEGPVIGSYEFRYLSEQPQIQNILDITTQGADRSTQLHVLVSDLLAPQPGEAHLFLPSAFYDVKTPRWDLTVLDQSVTNSPLTVDGAVLRGVHFKSDRWLFHAGYASLATFNGFIFPVQPEEVAGASYVIPLSPIRGSLRMRITSSPRTKRTQPLVLAPSRPLFMNTNERRGGSLSNVRVSWTCWRSLRRAMAWAARFDCGTRHRAMSSSSIFVTSLVPSIH